jgi:hypothetical protein
VGLGCIELTTEAEAWTAETWVAAEGTQTNREEWLPRLLVRRRAEAAPLASTFVAVLEPHDGVSRIRQARRLTVTPADGLAPGCEHVALEVALADGCRDVLVLADRTAGAPPESSGNIACSELGLQTDAAALWLRYSSAGHLEGLALAGGRRVAMQGIEVLLKGVTAGIELAFRGDRAEVVAGDRQELVGVQGR